MGKTIVALKLTVRTTLHYAKKHENFNLKSHRAYKDAMKWKQSVISGVSQVDEEEETYMMTATEETDSKGAAELDSMIVTRKDIHLKQGIDITNIFGYRSSRMPEGTEGRTDQVTLVVTEDRR